MISIGSMGSLENRVVITVHSVAVAGLNETSRRGYRISWIYSLYCGCADIVPSIRLRYVVPRYPITKKVWLVGGRHGNGCQCLRDSGQ